MFNNKNYCIKKIKSKILKPAFLYIKVAEFLEPRKKTYKKEVFQKKKIKKSNFVNYCQFHKFFYQKKKKDIVLMKYYNVIAT